MKTIKTNIVIDSTPQKVWNILTNFKEYELWNPFMTKVVGDANLGSKIEVNIKTMNGKKRTYYPIITKCETNSELRWKGKSILPGVFDGERIFILERSVDEKVSFSHKEIFSGLGVKFVGNKLDEKLRDSFVRMNEALKIRAELSD
ncbi:MAG TPA: SRPBCC domain-containing protein [Nitrososphaeraceae archaeon]|nr:SRPBCC domain-containing protein [Nitrososphaeraceae archaeon]